VEGVGCHSLPACIHFRIAIAHVAYRLTGKACNPQLIRDMAITDMINSGASVEVMKSLAELMGYSPQMQQKISSRHAQTQS
jgi:hypothetical protein